MRVVKSQSTIEMKIVIELSEIEARALYEMTRYSCDSFLKGFYNKLGKSYLQPYEKGVRSLFDTVGNEIPQHLDKINKARDIVK